MQSVHTNSLARDSRMDGDGITQILANFQEGHPISFLYPFEGLDWGLGLTLDPRDSGVGTNRSLSPVGYFGVLKMADFQDSIRNDRT